MTDGSTANPGKGALTRRAFVVRTTFLATATMSLGGCMSRCSTRQQGGPVVSPPPTSPDRTTITARGAALPDREPVVRVRIAIVRRDDQSPLRRPEASLSSESGWIRAREAETSQYGTLLKSPLRISRDGPRWRIIDAAGQEPRIGGGGAIELLADAETRGGSIGNDAGITVEGATYPGSIRLATRHGEAETRSEDDPADFELINHVALEVYLPGVLARELYPYWHEEAFAAQAIAARSFACSEIDHYRTRRHFDVTNTTRSQVYGGQTNLERAHRAVQRTRGMLLAYRNAVVPGYYSSCCGGIAANAVDAIGPNPVNDIPPLQSRTLPDACRNAPVYSWRVERSVDEISRRLVAWGVHQNHATLRNFGTIASIEILRTNAHGRPTAFEVRDAGSSRAEIPANRIIDALDFSAMGLHPPQSTLRSSFFTVEIHGRTAIIRGRGFGHGVGLCQHGAQALAVQGRDHRSILADYYPGAMIIACYL